MVDTKPVRMVRPVFDTTNFRKEWRTAWHKSQLGIFDAKTRNYRGAQLHDFRRKHHDCKGIQEDKALNVTGHKTNSMYKRYGIEEWIRSGTRSTPLPCDRI